MEVTYTQTFKEGVLVSVLATRHSAPIGFLVVWTVAIPASLVGLGALAWTDGKFQHATGIADWLADLAAWVGTIIGLSGAAFAYLSLSNWFRTRHQTVSIDQQALSTIYGKRKQLAAWPSVNRLDQDERYIYLGTKPSAVGGVVFAMVPKRAFGSPAEADAFYHQAMNYWRDVAGVHSAAQSQTWPPAPKVG